MVMMEKATQLDQRMISGSRFQGYSIIPPYLTRKRHDDVTLKLTVGEDDSLNQKINSIQDGPLEELPHKSHA